MHESRHKKELNEAEQKLIRFCIKNKETLFNVGSFSCETGINGSRRCTLYPPASVSAPFYGYSKLWLHDVEVTEDRTGDLSLRKPHTSQLSHDCL